MAKSVDSLKIGTMVELEWYDAYEWGTEETKLPDEVIHTTCGRVSEITDKYILIVGERRAVNLVKDPLSTSGVAVPKGCVIGIIEFGEIS